jgi:hypothetical protein
MRVVSLEENSVKRLFRNNHKKERVDILIHSWRLLGAWGTDSIIDVRNTDIQVDARRSPTGLKDPAKVLAANEREGKKKSKYLEGGLLAFLRLWYNLRMVSSVKKPKSC